MIFSPWHPNLSRVSCVYDYCTRIDFGGVTSHNYSDFIYTPIAAPATSASSYEIKAALLTLVMKEQFSGAGDDVALHLNNFVELCDMKKYKEVEGDIVKLKLFPFSLTGGAKFRF